MVRLVEPEVIRSPCQKWMQDSASARQKINFLASRKSKKGKSKKGICTMPMTFVFLGAVFILEESEAYITFLVVTSEEWPEMGHDAMGGWWIGFLFEVS